VQKEKMKAIVLLVAFSVFSVVIASDVYKTKIAVWTSGMETFNLKQAYPDHGLYNETQIADSVPKDQDLLVLLEIYEDPAAIEIIDRLKSHYPYYYRPRKVNGTSVQCKMTDVPAFQAFYACLAQKGITSLSFEGVEPCADKINALVAQNTDCFECFASEAFTEQIVKQSNALNRLYNHTSDLLTEPQSNAFTRCLTAPRDRYIYKGGTGFLVLSKKRIKSLSGSALPSAAIGLSSSVRMTGLVEATLNDGGVFMESPAVVLSRGYLQFQ